MNQRKAKNTDRPTFSEAIRSIAASGYEPIFDGKSLIGVRDSEGQVLDATTEDEIVQLAEGMSVAGIREKRGKKAKRKPHSAVASAKA